MDEQRQQELRRLWDLASLDLDSQAKATPFSGWFLTRNMYAAVVAEVGGDWPTFEDFPHPRKAA